MTEAATAPWLVVCLCAQWCGTCGQYQPAFDALAKEWPGMDFVWLDVEDEEEALGELDITTFPTVLLGRGTEAMFLGPVLPQPGVLQRMLERFSQGDARPLPAGDDAHALLQRTAAIVQARKAQAE
ncbi:thioredoxin family protein [Comamonas koreensis]|uniref:Thioredoxin family protein n=1 Tax=Comamonas koreensis TaxID=160825 RepID=A0AAW4XXW9_9BURK|nr:thioredoxin family protein [Comamonas koreensis]MCD2166312.1 thioredoxin family protein [Comamonas koreensis]